MEKNTHNVSVDTPLYRLSSKLSKWVAVSILWLGCSLPFITVGAASKAAIRASMATEDEDVGVCSLFFRAFVDGFWSVTFFWLFVAVGMALLLLDSVLYLQIAGQYAGLLIGITLLIENLLLNLFRMGCYCADGVKLGLIALIKKSFFIMVRCFPAVGMMVAIDLLLFSTLKEFPYFIFLVAIIPGMYADLHSRLIRGFLSRKLDTQ